jgi:hypothetical protein
MARDFIVTEYNSADANKAQPGAAKPHALHEVVKHLRDQQPSGQFFGKPRFKTREVIGFLLGHGARAWRGSMPVVRPRIKVMTPKGQYAAKIRFN